MSIDLAEVRPRPRDGRIHSKSQKRRQCFRGRGQFTAVWGIAIPSQFVIEEDGAAAGQQRLAAGNRRKQTIFQVIVGFLLMKTRFKGREFDAPHRTAIWSSSSTKRWLAVLPNEDLTATHPAGSGPMKRLEKSRVVGHNAIGPWMQPIHRRPYSFRTAAGETVVGAELACAPACTCAANQRRTFA